MEARALDRPADLDLAAAVLARAFADDPGYAYIFGERPDRLARITWLSRRFAEYTRRAGGEVLALGDPPRAVLLWMDVPPRWAIETLGMIRAGMYAAPLRMGPAALVRLMRFGARLDEAHARHMDRAHRYVFYVGVDPPHQGRGLGKALLRPKIDDAIARGMPLYLETLLPQNVKLYRSLGFEVLEESASGPGPRAWFMAHPGRKDD